MLPVELLATSAARRVQHARLAAAEVPRPRADQLGRAARRDRDRRDAARNGRQARRRRDRRADAGADPARRHRRRKSSTRSPSPPNRRSGACCPRCWRARRRACRTTSPHGSYFGGRKPEDGRIDWSQPAQQVYNLIRAVAPPYPGAFTDIGGERFIVARARLVPESGTPAIPAELLRTVANLPAGVAVADNALFGVCGDGRAIAIHELRHQMRAAARIQPTANASSVLPTSADSLNPIVTHEKSPDPRRQRLHRPSPVQAHPRNHRLGSLRDGHADRSPRRPRQVTSGCTSSKATSRSTRSGSSIT